MITPPACFCAKKRLLVKLAGTIINEGLSFLKILSGSWIAEGLLRCCLQRILLRFHLKSTWSFNSKIDVFSNLLCCFYFLLCCCPLTFYSVELFF